MAINSDYKFAQTQSITSHPILSVSNNITEDQKLIYFNYVFLPCFFDLSESVSQ